MKLIKLNINLFILIVFYFASGIIFAQHIKAPIDVQFKIIPKIISLDKTLKLRETDGLTLGLIYSSEQRSSMQTKEIFTQLLTKNKMNVLKKEMKIIFIDISKITNIKKYLSDNKIDIVYFTPLRGIDIDSISKTCKEDKILTLSGVLEFMQHDLSVSFDIINKRLQIVINNEAAKREGTIFSSRLLRIAKIM